MSAVFQSFVKISLIKKLSMGKITVCKNCYIDKKYNKITISCFFSQKFEFFYFVLCFCYKKLPLITFHVLKTQTFVYTN